jgi:hypothetical protein
MFSRKTIAAALVAATTLTAVPANANGFSIELGFGPGSGWQGNHGWHQQQQRLSPQEVRRILRHRGYRHIDFVDRNGPTYEVRASRRGRDFYLVVSARSGDILARYRI